MKKKNPLFFVLLLTALMVALAGCHEQPPDADRIKKDIPESWQYLYLDDIVYEMHITDLEIEKRQTNEKDDKVYFNFEMTDSTDTYTLTGGYVFYYVYYDEGGWILEGTQQQDDLQLGSSLQIKVDAEKLPSELWTISTEWFIDNAESWNLTEDPTISKSEEGEFVLTYDVDIKEKYQRRTGTLIVTYALEENDWLEYHWTREVDSSGIISTWDIIGEWYGEDSGDEIHISIDSYDETNQSIHISKMWKVTEIFGTLYEAEDITLYPKDNLDLWRVYSLDGIYGFNMQNLIFKPDVATIKGSLLEKAAIDILPNEQGNLSDDTMSNHSSTSFNEADMEQVKAALAFWETNIAHEGYGIYDAYDLDWDDWYDPGYGEGFYAVQTNPSFEEIEANFRAMAADYLSEDFINRAVRGMADNFTMKDEKIYHISGAPYIGINKELCQLVSGEGGSYLIAAPLDFDPVDMDSLEYFTFIWENGQLVLDSKA